MGTTSTNRRDTTRRSLLLGAVAAPLLGGCRLRLEDDAPGIPLLPQREPVRDEALLVDLAQQLRSLAAAARTAAPPQPAIARVHAHQADVLVRYLRSVRVPEATISASAPSTSESGTETGATGAPGTTSPSAAPSAPVRPEELTALELESLAAADVDRLGALTTPAAGVVRSIAAYRLALASRRGSTPRWPASATGPRATDADAGLLAAFRTATYALEVAAARSGTAEATAHAADPKATQRSLLVDASSWARSRASAYATRLGPKAPPPPVGYPVDPLPTNAAQARALATRTFARLELAIGAQLPHSGPAAATTVEALVATLDAGHRWGHPLRVFPGLVEPSSGPPAPAPGPPSATRPSPTPDRS